MSDPIDIIEHMFEYGAMQTASARSGTTGPGDGAPALRQAERGAVGHGQGADHMGEARAALERITALRSRISDMEATRVDTGALPTSPALAPLLPGGAIRSGMSYSVQESVLLAMTMLQAASDAGSWCAVVGVPTFGVEAAAAIGIDLERLVLVPDPGDQWLSVTAAMVDVATIVLTRPLGRIAPGDAARLSARLRQRGAALVSLGSWPGAEASLRVAASSWSGIGRGHGYLSERRATVVASGRAGAGRPTTAELLLPAVDGSVRAAREQAGAVPVPVRPRPEPQAEVAARAAQHAPVTDRPALLPVAVAS